MHNHRADRRGGNRSTTGKRKPGDEEIPIYEDSPQKARTIPDLFSKEKRNTSQKSSRALSPGGKRQRLDSNNSESRLKPELKSIDKMYSFSDTNSQPTRGSSSNPNAFRLGQTNGAMQRPAGISNSGHPHNFAPHAGAKKLVVKNLRVTPRLDQGQYFEKVWTQLDSALTAIFRNEKPSHSLEELYKGTENVCRQGNAENLVKKLLERCKRHVSGKVLRSLAAKTAEVKDIDVLRSVEAAWSAWNERVVSFRHLFANISSCPPANRFPLLAGHDSVHILLPRPVLPPSFGEIPCHT